MLFRSGSWRYKAPYPRPCPPPGKPTGHEHQVRPNSAMGGMPLGQPQGPEDLLVDADGTPRRIDKAFSWEAPLALHGQLHMVIRNAWAGDPYKIDTLFLYMANMAWNSAMNAAGTIAMLTARDPETNDYRIPRIIYSDAYFSEMVAYADLVLPDTTYLERWDCISILDRPIGNADGPADAIRQPIVKPDRDVRPFQDVLIDLGARLKLPGFTTPLGHPRYPRGYRDYMVQHERRPGVGPLAGWRGAAGDQYGTGAPNARQLERYVANGCFWRHEFAREERYYKHANRAYLETAKKFGFVDSLDPIVLQLYSEPLQRLRLAARGLGGTPAPETHRARLEAYCDPLPIWYPPFEHAALDDISFPLHAITQRPMPMYHSWGSQNAWLRQIMAENRIYIHRRTAAVLGVADDDWVWVVSHHGRVKAQARLMDGVNPHTVWTWNAVGKRAGAWNLPPEAPEATRGFLLNHLISELLPARGSQRDPNCDPVTGQAAWYDLKVRIERCDPAEAGETAPKFAAIPPLGGLPEPPPLLRYGAGFKFAPRLPAGGER